MSSVSSSARQPARIARAVEPLVVVAHEIAHLVAEAAELVEQPVAALGVLLDDRVLGVVQRPGLLEDRVRNGELPDVVDEAADRQRAEPAGREPELLADLDGTQRDATRVALGVGVLLGERHRQGANLGAEEDVLGRNEVGTAEVTGQRTRLCRVRQVDRDADADDEDPVELDLVPDPPAELAEVHGQRRDHRRREPDEPDDDRQIERAPREPVRAEGPDREQPERAEADRKQRERRRARQAAGTAGKSLGHASAEAPSAITITSSEPSRRSIGRTFVMVFGSGSTDAERITAPTGSVAPPVISTTLFDPNHTPGVAKPWRASRLAITANAVPTSIVRVSPRRAPMNVSPTAAVAAISALKPTE